MSGPQSADPVLHLWCSYGTPDGPALRVTARVCPVCHALVVDRIAHASWHRTHDQEEG